jgi:tetratricopeptide (TPR) repeat protein
MKRMMHHPDRQMPLSQALKTKRLKSLLFSLCLVGGVLAIGYLVWFWLQWHRPGMRYYVAGMKAMASNKPFVAEQLWLQGVKRDPRFYGCYEQLGLLYGEIFRYPQATYYLKQAADLNPNDGELQLELARAAHQEGRMDIAEAAAKRAMTLLPNNPEAVGGYGMIEAELHNREKAIWALRQAYHLKKDSRFLIAMVANEMDDLQLDQAEKDLTPYLQQHPNDPNACYLMGVLYEHKPHTPFNLRKAMAYAILAGKGMPNDVRPYTLLGRLLSEAGFPKKALRVYLAGSAIAPNDNGILNGLLECYRLLGDRQHERAVAQQYQKVLQWRNDVDQLIHQMQFNPHDVDSGLRLAHTEELLGDYAKALEYYELMVEQDPTNKRTRAALIDYCKRHHLTKLAKRLADPDYVPLVNPAEL